MSLTIDVLCNDGSPIGIQPTDIYGRGVGGAELALMSWAETMAERNHRVRVYNDPPSPASYYGVEYLPRTDFAHREQRDVFITYRSPNHYLRDTLAHVKLFWSCDQYTSGNFSTDIFPYVDRTICISPYHVDYHKKTYGVGEDKIGYFDLGVRLKDYDQSIEKIPGRCIYCSVPERGLEILHQCWPQIRAKVPHASLVITSDYRLWGAASPLDQRHRQMWLFDEGVSYLGKIERLKMVEEQLKAVCMSYGGTYQELFCISVAECLVSGTIPVTSTEGALPTTNELGYVIPGNLITKEWQEKFINRIINILTNSQDTKDMQLKARDRFDWHKIAYQWEHLIETGEYLTKEVVYG